MTNGRAPADLKNLVWKHDLRLWREDVVRQDAALSRTLDSKLLRRTAQDFSRKGTELGRRRALKHLKETLRPCTVKFEGAVLDERPFAVWSCVRSFEDGAANLEFLSIGSERARRDFWYVRAGAHAVERYFQRSGTGDFSHALWEANQTAAKQRLRQYPDGTEILLPAGDGALIGEIVEQETKCRYLLARSWVSHDMAVSEYAKRVVLPPLVEPPRPIPEWDPARLRTVDQFRLADVARLR